MTDGRSGAPRARLTKGEVSAIVATASRPLLDRIAKLEQRAPVRRNQAELDQVAAMIVKLDHQLAAQEVAKGIRASMPVRKRNATLGEQLREIAAESGVAKRSHSRWRGVL